LSKNMSGVYQAASVAKGLVEPVGANAGEAGGGAAEKVAVVDTRTAAGAEGLVVLAAATAARDNVPLTSVVAVAEDVRSRVRLVATLPSLEYLARGGRVPGAAAWGARWLGLNPIFEFKDGKVRPLRPARGRRLAFQRIVEIWSRDASRPAQGEAVLHVAALHALEPDVAQQLLDEVSRRVVPATAFVGSFSPVMVAHTGPGLVGLAWWWEERAGSRRAGSRRAGSKRAGSEQKGAAGPGSLGG
ncbi:MAG TPA: DegV family protein, partial [Acidimicrobiales bacterium]|nr:DegV family protein [Acidimicrobiales bacterium]